MRKVFWVLVVVILLVSFTGCKKSTSSIKKPQQKKIVEISSDPEGATVFIDAKEIDGVTPLEHSLLPGEHRVDIKKETSDGKFLFIYHGTINITNDKKSQSISATLEKRMQGSYETIRFDDKPKIYSSCSPTRDFADIYLNETVKVSGITYLDSFDLVFPSGKKIHFDTEKTGLKYVNGKDVRKFSKTVTFNETGEYKILSNGRIVTPGAGGYREYKFKVLYKAKPVDTSTLGDLNGKLQDKNIVLLPIGKTLYVKLFMEDAKGNIARNKPIGIGNLKTDKNGIVTIKVRSTQSEEIPLVIYNDILGWDAYFTTFDENGKLIESRFAEVNQKGHIIYVTPDYIPKKTTVKIENGHIFMPFDCSGLSLNDLGFKHTVNEIIVHPKNPAIIYTNSFISKDGGKTFHKFGDNLSFKVFAVDPTHPNIIYGYLTSRKGLFKSIDYGAHFTKIANFRVLSHITLDPKDSNKIYVTTDKEILISKDGGKTWQTFLSYPTIPWINPHNPNIIFAKNQRTVDGGKTWENINLYKKNPPEWNVPLSFAFDPKNPNVVYAVTYSHLFKSEDNGKNWTFTTMRYFNLINNMAIDPTNPEKIYIGDKDGILESDSGGKGFKSISLGVPTLNAPFSAAVQVDTQGNIYALFCGIPFKRVNGKWLPLNTVFLEGTPEWKIINGELYVDVKTIKSYTAAVQIKNGKITFYRLFDAVP